MRQGTQENFAKWGGVNDLITSWLAERQQLISQLCHLSGHSEGDTIDDFRNRLVDYLSAGHFEVFTELEAEARMLDIRGVQLMQAIYPYLEQSTEAALRFNDLCDLSSDAEHLRDELSNLALMLTDRFQLEDQLIEYVHSPQRQTWH